MPTKFPTCIMNIFIQAYNTKFSQCQCPQNPSQNSSSNITNYQHCQNSMSHQHCPNYTITKNNKYNTSKMLQSQDYNMINHTMPQIPTRAHNKMTMSHQQTFNEAWKQHFSKQRNQRKTHLEVRVGMWSMGLGVLKEPLLIIPFK